jgi:uncharacterized protein YjcR
MFAHGVEIEKREKKREFCAKYSYMKKGAKTLAQEMYLNRDYTQREIAEAVGATEKTIRAWIQDGDWEKMKSMRSVTRKQLLADSYSQLAAVNKKIQEVGGVPTKELYDAKSILRKEIETLSGGSMAEKIQTMEEFIHWLSRHSPKDVKLFGELSMKFLNDMQAQ